MDKARNEGAIPANPPKMASAKEATRASVKDIWKLMSKPVLLTIISTPFNNMTAKKIPLIPAKIVKIILSAIICLTMSEGFAPIALLIPISIVLSLMVTIIILLTPMAPDIKVPIPIIHTKKLIPSNKLSTI